VDGVADGLADRSSGSAADVGGGAAGVPGRDRSNGRGDGPPGGGACGTGAGADRSRPDDGLLGGELLGGGVLGGGLLGGGACGAGADRSSPDDGAVGRVSVIPEGVAESGTADAPAPTDAPAAAFRAARAGWTARPAMKSASAGSGAFGFGLDLRLRNGRSERGRAVVGSPIIRHHSGIP
jgi:hypothetical protein